jgi:multicomponent K+:H+ antiporter subunit G
MSATLPLWAQYLVAALVLCGGLLALIGSFGLMVLGSFFQRIHAPTLVATLGMWCIALASVVYFSALDGSLQLHGLLITLFVALTAPITTIFLMRAAVFRKQLDSQRGPH